MRDLFDVSASFYAFLGEERVVPRHRAAAIKRRLTELAMGLR